MKRRHQMLLKILRQNPVGQTPEPVTVVLEGEDEPTAYRVHWSLDESGEYFAHDAGKPGCSCETLSDETVAMLDILESELREGRKRRQERPPFG